MCLFPQKAQLNEIGRLKFTNEGDLKIPCGKCVHCISKRAIEWATRAKHEIASHKENCFITLTYNNESLPSIYIVKDEYQKFIKRLRKKTKIKIRYMVSHEYGSKNFRPHHHAIIFGYEFPDQKHYGNSKAGHPMFSSKILDSLWSRGNATIGTANEKTAYYIASYALKGNKNTLTDPMSGEIITVSDCMDSSKRPAIGLEFFKKNYQQMIDTESILPRYYFKKLQEINPTLHEHYENERMLKFTEKTAYEKNASYIINKAQKNLDSKFRLTTDEQKKYDQSTQNYLQQKLDEINHLNIKDLI